MLSAALRSSVPSHGTVGVRSKTSRVFAQFSAFRPEVAFQAAPVLPTFNEVYNVPSAVSLARPGAILLTFVKRTPGSTSFDWRAKEMFALSPIEAANVTLRGIDQTILLEHAGEKAAKQLEISAGNDTMVHPDGTVGGVSLQYMSGPVAGEAGAATELGITLSHGEMFVLTQLMTNALPALYGWDKVLATEATASSSGSGPPYE